MRCGARLRVGVATLVAMGACSSGGPSAPVSRSWAAEGTVDVRDFGALGDGVHNDLPAIRAAISACPPGGMVVFPRPAAFYRISAPGSDPLITVTRPMTLRAAGGSPRTFLIANVDEAGQLERRQAILSVGSGARQGHTWRVEGLCLKGGQVGLDIVGPMTRLSRFRDLVISHNTEASIRIRGNAIGAGFENLQLGGAPVGVLAQDTTYLNETVWDGIRISNTHRAAIQWSNPHPSSAHSITLRAPIIEGNRGVALDLSGGLRLRVEGGHFEANTSHRGEADIVMGGGARALCEVQLNSTQFSSPGAKQGYRRVLFRRSHSRLTMIAARIPESHVVDMAGHTIGSRVYGILLQTVPQVVGGGAHSTAFWPPQPTRGRRQTSSPTKVRAPSSTKGSRRSAGREAP